jgi:hypothetical protein
VNIASLFISLGVKGNDKAASAITGVRKGLQETAGASLQAKAAILGVIYTLQRMFSISGQVGTDLTNFNATLGVSAKTLQQYQYAARQVGVSNQAMESTFKSLQDAMTRTLMGEGAPEGLAQFALKVGDIMPEDIDAFSKNPEKLLQKLQEYAQKEKNIGLRNKVLKSFGIGDDMVAALSRNAFTPDVLKKAPTYNESEIKALDRANIAWDNLGQKIQRAFGHFNAQHGGKLVSDLSKLTDSVLKLADAFMKLANSAKLFEGIGKIFDGWVKIFEVLTTMVGSSKAETKNFFTDQLPQMFGLFDGDRDDDDARKRKIEESLKRLHPNREQELINRGLIEPQRENTETDFKIPEAYSKPWWQLKPFSPGMDMWPQIAAPKIPQNMAQPAASQKEVNQNINVNQTMNFQHEGADPGRVAQTHKEAIQKAFRQMSAQAQGS